MKLLIPLFALLGLAAMAWSIDLSSTQNTPESFLREAGPRSSTPTGVIYAAGRVEGASEETDIRPEIVGRIAEVLVQEGDTVGQGDVLIRLDDASLARKRDLAASQIVQAEAELARLINGAHAQERAEARALVQATIAKRDLALKTWQRVRELRTSSAVTEQNADEQEAKVHAAEAELAAARARLELLASPTREDEVLIAQAKRDVARAQFELTEADLAKTRIVAPIDGTILKVDAEPGELVGPTSTQPAIVLADTSQLRVRAFVEELNAPRVAVGMPARVTADGLPDSGFQGIVGSVSPTMTKKTLTSDRSNELYDTKVREVLLNLTGDAAPLVIGLRVDVMLDATESSNQ